MFFKKPKPLSGRKVFEYSMAGVMTGICVPVIYRGYAAFTEKVRKKVSIRIDDLMEMREEQDED